jgi:hypothetical protein
VKTYNQYGESDFSNTLEVNFLTSPGTPQNLTEKITERTETSVEISWLEPQRTGGSPDVLYEIELCSPEACSVFTEI